MNDANAKKIFIVENSEANKSLDQWQARLSLEFAQRSARSFLAKKQHSGPLVIQKTLYPEGDEVCHGIIIHPPGGVAGGDDLSLEVSLLKNANVLLTTPGAGKWYKANHKVASQHLQFDLAENACLEWLPQENIMFDGAVVDFSATINLAKNAKYAAWEILCLGRQAKNERWNTGKLNQNLMIQRQDKVIWQERSMLMAGDRFFQSLVGLGGNVVSGSFVIVAGGVPAELLAKCQQVKMESHLDIKARYGVTALSEVFSARYIGMSAPAARQYFESLWHILRPWYLMRPVTKPRIWNT